MQVVYTEWAFGRDRRLLQKFAEICLLHNLQVCDCLSLAELNRTFFAIAGKSADQYEAFVQLLDEAFETLDLNRLPSPVPRLGALDLVEITPPDNVLAMGLAQLLVLRDVPVLFGEGMSSQLRDGEHLALRERGFGGMIEAAILPDFGPTTTHPRLGTTTFAA